MMVYVLLGEGFEEMEALAPVDLLRRAGEEVQLVGVDGYRVTGANGITVTADNTLMGIDVDQMRMLVLPGGLGGVDSIRANLSAMALIQKAADVGCWLAAICAAPTILAQMGLLDRRRAVCYPGMEDQMFSAVVDQSQSVIKDGRIITGRGPGAAYDFGLKLVEVLKGASAAEEIRAQIHYR